MRLKIVVLAFVFPMLFASCRRSGKSEESKLIQIISDHQAVVEPLDERICETFLQYVQTGSRDCVLRHDSLERIKTEFLHDAERFAILKQLREHDRIQDEYLKRQLEILYRQYLACQADLSLQHHINRLQTELKSEIWKRGKRQHAQSFDDTLTCAKEDSMTNEVSLPDSLMLLISLRNEMARRLGFSDYYMLRLFLDEQEPERLDSLFARLEQQTDSAFLRLKEEAYVPCFRGTFTRYGQRPENMKRDACYNYINMPQLATRFFSGIGLEVEDVVAHSDLSRCYAKIPLFRCVSVNKKDKIRIVGTLSGKETDMFRLLGCCGEAAYWKGIPHTLPYLLRRPSSFMLRMGVAVFFSRMVGCPEWISGMGIFSAGQADAVRCSTGGEYERERLFFCRWALMVYHFERRLYADPGENPDTLWREMNRRFLLLDLNSDYVLSQEKQQWWQETYFGLESGRIHNLLLAELWAAQVTEHLCARYPKLGEPCNPSLVGNEEVGEYFKKFVFEPGATLRWDELTRIATGKDLGSEAFVKQFCRKKK